MVVQKKKDLEREEIIEKIVAEREGKTNREYWESVQEQMIRLGHVLTNIGTFRYVPENKRFGDQTFEYFTEPAELDGIMSTITEIAHTAERHGFELVKASAGGGMSDLETGYMSFGNTYKSVDELQDLPKDFDRAIDELDETDGWYHTFAFDCILAEFVRDTEILSIAIGVENVNVWALFPPEQELITDICEICEKSKNKGD